MFQDGIHSYLVRFLGELLFWLSMLTDCALRKELHKYSNAETKDLWEALTHVTDSIVSVDIADMMDTWTNQVGFPYIELKPLPDNMLRLTQVR